MDKEIMERLQKLESALEQLRIQVAHDAMELEKIRGILSFYNSLVVGDSKAVQDFNDLWEKVKILDARSHSPIWGEVYFDRRCYFPFENDRFPKREEIEGLGYVLERKVGHTEIWIQPATFTKPEKVKDE